MNLLTICQKSVKKFATELYFDLVEILVKVQNSVVRLYYRVTGDRRELDGLGFINE